MKIKVNTVFNKFDKECETVKKIHGKGVSVGVFGEQAWLAGIHEYGCRIEVTPKMRAFLHHQGLHLKKSTQFIVIPERSFLRSGFDACHIDVLNDVDKIVPFVLEGAVPVREFLELAGLQLKSKIQDYAENLNSPPNHPYTTKTKNSSNPLIDTGDMVNSISYEVKDNGSLLI